MANTFTKDAASIHLRCWLRLSTAKRPFGAFGFRGLVRAPLAGVGAVSVVEAQVALVSSRAALFPAVAVLKVAANLKSFTVVGVDPINHRVTFAWLVLRRGCRALLLGGWLACRRRASATCLVG